MISRCISVNAAYFFAMKKILLLITLIQATIAQNVPFESEHPVYHFLEQQESRGRIDSENWSTKPYSISQINAMIAEISDQKGQLSAREIRILKKYQREFNREFSIEGISFPWDQSARQRLFNADDQDIQPFFITYNMGTTKGWVNWSETFRIQHNGDAGRGYHTDVLGIIGQKGKIAFATRYTFYRITRTDKFSDLPSTYKEGFLLDREYMKWINWGYPTSSLTYNHADFTLGIHRQPVYWGYSTTNSPIISNNVNPLPYIEWTTQIPHLRFKFIHARLSSNTSVDDDSVQVRRNLSAHRVEFDVTPNFEFAFNEMVIYANRDFELGYLNPVNFLFAEEQVQGDLDNKLMAIDFKWLIIPGLTSYGTWFFDELDFWKLFSGWWGNKFVFQMGATYYPLSNLPSLSLEYTAARPWTYSHSDPVNSYTSAGRLLGLVDGPNTQSIRMASSWQINSKLFFQGEILWLQRGDDPGSDPLTSYSERGNFEEEDSNFLSGDIEHTRRAAMTIQYEITQPATIIFHWDANNFLELGVKLDW